MPSILYEPVQNSTRPQRRVFTQVFRIPMKQISIDGTADGRGPGGHVPTAPRTLKERLRWPLMLALPIVLVVASGARYMAGERYVVTDDAFVRAARDSINARVSGQGGEGAGHDNPPGSK